MAMHALTYCYEGYNDSSPYACTIAVSEDRDKLIAEMENCVAEDCREMNEDELEEQDENWDNVNYEVYEKYDGQVILRHKENNDLYTKYRIHEVKVL
jgi:hypothetical protein